MRLATLMLEHRNECLFISGLAPEGSCSSTRRLLTALLRYSSESDICLFINISMDFSDIHDFALKASF